MKHLFISVLTLCLLSFMALATFAQADLQTRGAIKGTVTDPTGAVVAGATVSLAGPTGERTATTNADGTFEIANLTPGPYTVKVTNQGFKTTSATTTVFLGKTSNLDLKLEVGEASAVVEVVADAGVDQSTTAISTNLNDQLFENIPVARGVSGLFYLAPGTTDSLGGGRDNPSISGGSALDNLYIADGVNVTDSAFGGMGTFSRSYGALGTGINTSFIKEVQVKTAGFEPQYGQSQGGIVNIVTQSGSNEYHGAIYGYATPKAFEAKALQPDEFPRFNRGGQVLHNELYDAGVDFGGYVPGARENLFFFGSFNPSVRRTLVRGAEANSLATTDSGLRLIRGEEFANRITSYNYAFKAEYLVNPSHQITFSIFGDPSKTNKGSWRTLNTDNTTADSILEYGTRNMSFRYNGTWSPTLTFNASLGFGKSRFDEFGFDNFQNIVDRRGSDALNIEAATGFQPANGNFSAVGLGFFEPTESKTTRADFNLAKTVNWLGQHTLGTGYTYQRGNYDGIRDRSGPHVTIPNLPANGVAAGQEANVQWRLRYRTNDQCSANAADDLCGALFPVQLANGTTQLVPVRLQVIRAEFGEPVFTTFSDYHAAYVQDTWRFNRFVTGLFGLRWEQERLTGSPGPSGFRAAYSFTGQWAPRLGVTVDPFGKGKTKAFYNFGRFFEYLPLDMAERSLSAEQDWTGNLFVPEFTIQTINGVQRRVAVVNQFGTVNPIVDTAHQLPGAATLSLGDPSNPITPGTKLGYSDEHTFGFEHQLPWNLVVSARYIDRRAKRIIEDAASVSPEAALAGIGQVYYIGNVSSTLDAAINLVPFQYTTGGAIPAGCAQTAGVPDFNFDGSNNQSVCFAATGIDADHNAINLPDGIPDGFPDPIRKYRAVEIELNKRFSNNWQGFFNWRIAKLEGNFEGHLRNDNGQTDPGISSLFDFTAGDLGLLGNQFAVGPLNSDRRHIINMYGSYNFGKDGPFRPLSGLNLGLNMHFETGLPINGLDPHPVYLNTGEIPVGGRGSFGRTPNYTRFDVHADYSWALTEKTRLKFVADLFNIFNSQKLFRPDENTALDFNAALGTNPPNPDFLKPRQTLGTLSQGYHPPFNMRLGLRFEF
jgi:hypothetical protein